MFPTPFRAKSLVWYTSPLMPGPLAFGSLASLPAAHTILDEVQHVPCPLAFVQMSPLPGCPVLSPSSDQTGTFLLTIQDTAPCPFLCETSLTHLAEYALPFACHSSDTISL